MPITTVQWEWEEAFDKYGFGDGDGLVMTDEVVDLLEEQFRYTVYTQGGIHNHFIGQIDTGGQVLEFDGYPEGGQDPRKMLPAHVVRALDETFGPGVEIGHP